MGTLENVVNLMTPDNSSLKLKAGHWETASKGVTSDFLASYQIYTKKKGGHMQV